MSRDCPRTAADSERRSRVNASSSEAPAPTSAPSFALSGALAADAAARSVGSGAATSGGGGRGAVLKFSEPVDARVPGFKWHLHVFRGSEPVDAPLYIHRRSATLFGRDRAVADVPTDHPSCSAQHAVLQFRLVAAERSGNEALRALVDEAPARTVKPYLLDLESTNGSYLNGKRVDAARYIELRAGDSLRFGSSSREYVLLHDDAVV